MQAIVLNTTESPAVPQPWLAGLPVLLRAALTAQRAGLKELLIVGGEDPGKLFKHRKNLEISWRWIPAETSNDAPTELDLLRQAQGKIEGDFALLFADSVFDVAALQSLCEAPLNGQTIRQAADPNHPGSADAPGLYLCSPAFLQAWDQAAGQHGAPTQVGGYADSLHQQNRLDELEIQGRLWGRASSRNRLKKIERELTHFNLKPSDGNFARFNKLVLAEPLIRFFLCTPATPNFITFLGLLLAIAGGLVAAHGGYFWILAGALLNFFSAIMDHVDGMVARLKFMESHFGTWFETFVDYSSYLFFFSGLGVGLYRETGEIYNLVFLAIFLVGAALGIIFQSRQRHQTAKDNPADYINRLHHSLEKESSNFFHWVSRNLYFVVRRAVLPYVIVFFCLMLMRELLLGWVALGANAFWILLLNTDRVVPSQKPAEVE